MLFRQGIRLVCGARAELMAGGQFWTLVGTLRSPPENECHHQVSGPRPACGPALGREH